jgi:membrane-associated PAP2 superfamily phosphatase
MKAINPCSKLAFFSPIRLTAFHRRAMIGLVLSGLFLLMLMRFSHIDIAIEDYYFDAHQQLFPWKSTWFAKTLMHEYVKQVLQSVGVLLCGVVLSDLVRPWLTTNWWRVRLRFVALSVVLIPLVILLFKRASALHCPWDIDRYGGAYAYFNLFDKLPANASYGHCFPAGHASSGLWLAALAVFWLPHQPNQAGRILILGLGVGFVLGWVQQMRGAHFLTHTLMSVWLTCCILLILQIFTPQLNEK